ncbi:MAG: FAD-binding oxidoreductase [Verrucomicrobiota bacterium]
MTVTVAGEVSLASLQTELAKNGQWLPVDPPGNHTIRTLLDSNSSGPRRYGFGTIREHLLGLRVQMGNQVINAGGKVVKNVAGYDLCRLMVGANGTLGAILEATFKLRPLPEVEQFVQKQCASLDEAGALIAAVQDSPVLPVVLDLISPATVVVGLADTREDVEWQLQQLTFTEPATLDYNREFPQRVSVLPSKLIETVRGLTTFVARAGNGVVYLDSSAGVSPVVRNDTAGTAALLQQRVREAFRG